MDLAVTAIYHSHAVAHLVRGELERAGVESHRITVLPGARIVPNPVDASGSATTPDNIEDALHRLKELHLSESGNRICREALQNGAHVVSVSLDEAGLGQVREVMDRPGEVLDPDKQGAAEMITAAPPVAGGWAAVTG